MPSFDSAPAGRRAAVLRGRRLPRRSAASCRAPPRRLALAGLGLAYPPRVPPGIPEPSTAVSMGQSAELMAKLNGRSRADQDAWALRSHLKAAAAWDDGRLAQEVAPVYVASDGGRVV